MRDSESLLNVPIITQHPHLCFLGRTRLFPKDEPTPWNALSGHRYTMSIN